MRLLIATLALFTLIGIVFPTMLSLDTTPPPPPAAVPLLAFLSLLLVDPTLAASEAFEGAGECLGVEEDSRILTLVECECECECEEGAGDSCRVEEEAMEEAR
jgi:hypothetical protein